MGETSWRGPATLNQEQTFSASPIFKGLLEVCLGPPRAHGRYHSQPTHLSLRQVFHPQGTPAETPSFTYRQVVSVRSLWPVFYAKVLFDRRRRNGVQANESLVTCFVDTLLSMIAQPRHTSLAGTELVIPAMPTRRDVVGACSVPCVSREELLARIIEGTSNRTRRMASPRLSHSPSCRVMEAPTLHQAQALPSC